MSMRTSLFSCLRLWLLPLLVLLTATGCASLERKSALQQGSTIVYVVRHGEKKLTPGLADPALTAEGQQRAQALRDTLRKQRIDAVFSTNTKRTQSTAEPLASARKLSIQPYDARQLAALATRIRRQHQGQTLLVVGHSNTILETAEALGAPRPVASVQDNEYDYLLEVRIPRDSTQAATAIARRYGTGVR